MLGDEIYHARSNTNMHNEYMQKWLLTPCTVHVVLVYATPTWLLYAVEDVWRDKENAFQPTLE